MVSLLHYYLQKYNIKRLAYSIISNDFHLCVIIKKDSWTCAQMATSYKRFTRGKFDLTADDDHIKHLRRIKCRVLLLYAAGANMFYFRRSTMILRHKVSLKLLTSPRTLLRQPSHVPAGIIL